MKLRPWRAGAAFVVAGSLLAACSGGSDSSSPDTSEPNRITATTQPHTDEPGAWTVMVYMDGDNNLEGAALEDLLEMGDATNTEFVVLLDRSPGYASGDLLGLGDFTDSVLLHVADGQAEMLDTPGEVDMGDPSPTTPTRRTAW
jgi:hypothetical protein